MTISSRTFDALTRRSFIARLAACGFAATAGIAHLAGAGSALAEEFSASPETQAALADAQAQADAAQAQLNDLNNQIFDAEAAYEQTSAALAETTQQIEDLQVQIEDQAAQLSAAQDVLANRINADYRAGRTALLDILLQSTSFDDFIERSHYATSVSDADARAIQDVKDIKAQLEASQALLAEQQAQQQALQDQQAQQIDDLNNQIADVESYKAGLDSWVQELLAQAQAEIEAQAEAARQAAAEAAAAQAASEAAQAAAAAAAEGGYVNATTDDAGNIVADTSYGGESSSGGYQPTNVVAAAYAYLGTPYSVLDCSGLTSAAYADCGYYLYHQSGVQYNTVVSAGNLVGADGLVPGNLVFYSRGGSIYHVAMYVGDGMIIESIPSSGVAVHSLYYCDGFCGGGSPF